MFDKSIKIANSYKRNELRISFIKKIVSTKLDQNRKILKVNARIVQTSLKKYQKPTRFRAFCNFTKKTRGVLRDFKINSYSLKENPTELYFNSLKRAS